jgi:N-acetylneuraminate synthase
VSRSISIGGIPVGDGCPVFIIAEIGINHNGDLSLAKKLIDIAVGAGCNAVKFQKRTPEACVPAEERNKIRETPWGRINYLEYRKRLEFNEQDYGEISDYCQKQNIIWFASSWDVESVSFLDQFSPPCHKIASACLTNEALIKRVFETARPVILSTGMSSIEEIRHAVSLLDQKNLVVAHSTSTYPCPPEEINLRMILRLREEFDCPIAYSGHEEGLQATYAAVALGACMVERHVTLDRHMWGSDQQASVEPSGLFRLVRDIQIIEKAMGDGIKKVYESEMPSRDRLRGK